MTGRLFFLCLASLLARTGACADLSLCQPREFTYFSCELEGTGKLAAVCGPSPGSTAVGELAYLQYRYGRPGHLELVYPAKKSSPLRHFRWIALGDAHGLGKTLSFQHAGAGYQVFSKEASGQVLDAGVSISRSGVDKTFKCASPATPLADLTPFVPDVSAD